MKPPVGYLVKHKQGLRGERGIGYDYVLAGNGVFVEAEGKLLGARVLVAPAEVRGLPSLQPRLVLRHGRIPGTLFDLAVGLMVQQPRQEIYIGIYWSGEEYRLWLPNQEQGSAHVQYERRDGLILDIHSHCGMAAYFSGTDNKDETGLQAYAVVGNLPNYPSVTMRYGVYGYHQPIRWADVFSGPLPNDVEEGPVHGAVYHENLGWVAIPAVEEEVIYADEPEVEELPF